MQVYIRRALENGQPIFKKKFCLTNAERDERNARGEKVESVAQLKADLIPSEFAALYLNDPVDSDAIEFKPAWFQQISDLDPWRESKCLMAIDPAFRLKETNDFTGITISRINQEGKIAAIHAEPKKLNAHDLVNHVFNLVKIYRPDKVIVETVAAQVVLLELFRKKMQETGLYFVLEEVKLDTKETKAMRIRALIPFYANLQVFHAPGLKDLENQLVEFPRGLHDDVIDSWAHHVPFWKAPHKIAVQPSVIPGSFDWWRKLAHAAKDTDRLFSDFRRK